jgi:hypothetical protein
MRENTPFEHSLRRTPIYGIPPDPCVLFQAKSLPIHAIVQRRPWTGRSAGHSKARGSKATRVRRADIARRREGASARMADATGYPTALAQRCEDAARRCGRFADSSPRRAGLAPPITGLSSLLGTIGGGRRLTSVDWMIEVVVIA